jgi:hypothetical protein
VKDSLGARTHYETHLRRARIANAASGRELPDIHARDYTSHPGVTAHRTHIYPTSELVNAIDHRAGKTVWQSRDLQAEQGLLHALDTLARYDPVMPHVLRIVCLEGRWRFKRGRGIVHLDWEPAARLIDAGDTTGALDDRKTWDWLHEAWTIIGLLTLAPAVEGPPTQLKDWLRRDPLARKTHAKLQSRGLL